MNLIEIEEIGSGTALGPAAKVVGAVAPHLLRCTPPHTIQEGGQEFGRDALEELRRIVARPAPPRLVQRDLCGELRRDVDVTPGPANEARPVVDPMQRALDL